MKKDGVLQPPPDGTNGIAVVYSGQGPRSCWRDLRGRDNENQRHEEKNRRKEQSACSRCLSSAILLEVRVMKSALRVSPLWAIGLAIGLVVVLAARVQGSPPDRASSAIAGDVTTLMGDRHLDAIAAQDPEQPDRFVAALLIPNSQLLVVSATYPNPGELQAQLAQKNYRDVYAALQQPVAQQTRIFFIDAGCDGLRSGGDAVDIMYEKGTQQTLFDGRWKPQGLTEAAYTKKVESAEHDYSRLLSILVASIKGA